MRGKQATALAASTAAAPLPPLSPIVKKLRQMWRFAAICQFLFTFDEAFGMSGFETEALERDLDGSETQMIPDLMRRLLYTLTLNREIDSSNWESYLRAQYEAREPKNLLLGTAESPLPWAALPLTAKVDTIYTLCEWQLVDAERFRKLVKNDEDAQIWRIDPIGWDGQDNTYWLFDDNRLWIQHPPPPEPVKARPPKKNSKKARAEAAAAKRAAQKAAEGPSTPKPSSVAKRKRDSLPTSSPKPRREPLRSSTRGKPVTEISAPTPSPQKRTRRSLRGDADGWEEIPPELLYEGQSGRRETAEKGASTTQNGRKANGDAKQRNKREGSTDSELSEPPSLDDEKKDGEDVKMEDADTDAKVEEAAPSIDTNGHQKAEEESPKLEEEEQVKEEVEEKPAKEEEKPEWIEFEAIAVTRPEWEAIATKFAKSKHPDEKALHALLSDTVIPKVMRDIAEVEKQRAHEAAMASRKRSSRIALKESEKEERERDRAARLAMEERMASLRREEQDKANREEEERKAVKHREDRLREREERILAREREAEEKALREIQEREERERMREIRKQRREEIIANGGVPTPEPAPGPSAQGSEAQDGDSWELDCEVCGKAGINLDDTDEIVCCERCGVWQHTECWNAFDRSVHHPRRDWEKEDFFCSKCRPPVPGQPWPQRPQRLPQAPSVPSQRPAVPPQAHSPYAQQQYMPAHNVQHPQQQQQQQQQRYGYPPQQTQPMPMQQQALQPSHVRPQQQHLYQHPQQIHAHPPPQPQQQYLQQQYQQYQQHQQFQPQLQHQHRPQGQQSPVPAAQGHQSYPSPSAFVTSRPPQGLHSGPSHGSAAPSAPPTARPVPAAAPPRPQPAASPAHPALNGAAHSSAAAVPRPNHASPISSPSAAAPARPATQASPLASNQTPISASSPVSQKPAPSTPGSVQEQRSSPGTTNGSSSMAAPTSSPLKSPSAKPFVHRASQPSGSFPLRHTPAKSPLSGGHAPSPPVTGTANAPIPAISLGPARATSPSPGPKGAGTVTLGSTPPISQQARDPNSLYSRQTPSSTTSTPGSQTSTGPGDGRASASVQGPPSGPGPASGSLVRPDQDRRTVGPSLPRGPFGSTAPSQTAPDQASSQPPVGSKLNQAPIQPAAAVAQQQQQQQQQVPVSGPPSSTAQQPHQM